MKKAITLALVAALLTATGITAYATDITADSNPKTGGTTVNYTVNPAYTVVIPESVTLTDADVTATISIYGATADDNVVIGKKQKVNVALTASANNFNVANTDGDTIAYTVNDKNAVADLTTVAECAANTTSETELTFAKTGTAAYAGTYTDTLTFTVSLANAEGEKTLAEQVTTDNSVVRVNFDFTAGGETNATYVEYTYNNGTFTRTGQTESFSPSGTWTVTESSGVLTFTAYYDPGFGDSVLNYSSTINLNDLTYSESNNPTSDNPRWTMTLTGIDVNDTPAAITQN